MPTVPAAAGSTRATKEAAEEMAKAASGVGTTDVATADMEAIIAEMETALLIKNGKKGMQGAAGSRASWKGYGRQATAGILSEQRQWIYRGCYFSNYYRPYRKAFECLPIARQKATNKQNGIT